MPDEPHIIKINWYDTATTAHITERFAQEAPVLTVLSQVAAERLVEILNAAERGDFFYSYDSV